MPRPFHTFVGVDLGGARGKSTAIARLAGGDDGRAVVQEVLPRAPGGRPWHDDALVTYVAALGAGTAVAIDAPLTLPACIRCVEATCPGQAACADPAVVWLNTIGAELAAADADADRDRIAAAITGSVAPAPAVRPRRRPLLSPYTHRPAAVHLRHARGIRTRETLGQGTGPITARAAHVRRALARHGFALNDNLIEVSPPATVHALFGPRRARGYKRDADPWETRAEIVEQLRDLQFAPTSGFSREQVLRNDHCFDAVLSAYTAFLWARDDWQLPAESRELFARDGWIWTPEPARRA